MLIYGNTPKDIGAMIWRRRYRFVTVLAVIIVAVMLMGCAKTQPQLKALDKFWDALGGKTENLSEKDK